MTHQWGTLPIRLTAFRHVGLSVDKFAKEPVLPNGVVVVVVCVAFKKFLYCSTVLDPKDDALEAGLGVVSEHRIVFVVDECVLNGVASSAVVVHGVLVVHPVLGAVGGFDVLNDLF